MSNSSLKSVLISIIGCELCERLAFYSLSGNLTLFVRRNLNISTSNAAIVISLWIGLMYIFAVIFGYIADKYLNRYRTVIISGCIYFIGLFLISTLTIITETSKYFNLTSVKSFVYIALCLIAVGAGGIKSNIGPLGADQFKSITDTDLIQFGMNKKSYWNWFYFAINIGSLIAFTLVSYICQNISFSIGYTIPTICLLLALLIFYLSRNNYIIIPPSQNIVIYDRNQQQQRENDKKIIKQIFIFCLLEVMYWTVYTMQSTLFLSQACQMNIKMENNFEIPIASLDLANIAVILILIPIVDRIIYPYFTNWTILQKIGIGMIFVVMALICAAIVEVVRKQDISNIMTSTCDDKLFVSNLSVLWQIPQYLLIGIAEVLTVINSYNFFFTEAPLYWKSMTYSFNYVSYALGSWLQTLLLLFVNYQWNWIKNDLNQSQLENYFILCAGLLFIDVLVFIVYSKRYKYKNIKYPYMKNNIEMQQNVANDSVDFAVNDVKTETMEHGNDDERIALNTMTDNNTNYDSCS